MLEFEETKRNSFKETIFIDIPNMDKADEIKQCLFGNHMSILEKHALGQLDTYGQEGILRTSLILNNTEEIRKHSECQKNVIFNNFTTENSDKQNEPKIEEYHESLLEKTLFKYEPLNELGKLNSIKDEEEISVFETIIDQENIIEDAAVPRILTENKPGSMLVHVKPPSETPGENRMKTSIYAVAKRSLSVSDMPETQLTEASKTENLGIATTITEKESTELKSDLPVVKKAVIKSSKYMLIRTIGRGNFSKVKLAKHLATDKVVAIKIIDKTKLEKKVLSKITREVALMKELTHPNIVKLLEVMENETTLYLVMEYASGGELFDYSIAHGNMKEKEARLKFREMISAVHYCHSKSIVHRDLKAENVLLNKKMEIKIADFGFANRFKENSLLSTFCGSPPYAAPELFKGEKYVGPEVDVWALGVILFIMVSGRLPFDAHTMEELKKKVINLRYELPYFISNECGNLMRKMLVVNTQERATLEMILNDPWVNGGGLPKLEVYSEEQFTICPIIVEQLREMGFHGEDIEETFKEKKFNSIHATYLLLLSSSNYDNAVLKTKSVILPEVTIAGNIDSISRKSKIRPINESHSLTGTTGTKLAKNFKNWLMKKSDSLETGKYKESIPSSESVSKEFQKQWAQAMPHLTKEMMNDPNSSIPKGANQQAILATLNQMSLSKHHKAGMFQATLLGSPQPKHVYEKNQITALNNPTKGGKTSINSNESTNLGKFTVESVKFAKPAVPIQKTSLRKDRSESEVDGGNKKTKVKKSKKNKDDNTESTSSKPKKIKEKQIVNKDSINIAFELSQVAWSKFDPKIKPRTASFAFSLNTTSSKEPFLIVIEIIRVLNENKFTFEFLEKYLLLCNLGSNNVEDFGDSIQWEMEVCRIPILFMNGVRMKRIFGSSFAYKQVASKITHSLRL